MAFKLPSVYPITDKQLSGRPTHLSIIKDLVRGGAQIVQIRDKYTPLKELLPDLRRCVEFCNTKSVMVIINDRCDLALITNASGVHLGQDDLPPDAARQVMGRRVILGYSTHSPVQVRRASDLPVHYIAVGPVYFTSTKKDPSIVVGVEMLRRAARISSKPVVAIGGIGLAQVRQVLASGAQSVAVISALMRAPNIAREMERFLKEATATG